MTAVAAAGRLQPPASSATRTRKRVRMEIVFKVNVGHGGHEFMLMMPSIGHRTGRLGMAFAPDSRGGIQA
jgi:hypothetical protein